MSRKDSDSRFGDRITAALGAALLQCLLLYVLIVGLAGAVPMRVRDDFKLFTIAPKARQVEKPVPHHAPSHKPDGAAAPPALKALPSAVVAPLPVVPPRVPVPAPPRPGTGSAPAAGAASLPGPGVGAGGQGNGTGSGDAGDGDGDDDTPARCRRCEIRDSDYPRAVAEAGIGGTVLTRFTIGTSGRVTACAVTRASGNAALDQVICGIIQARFRYDPARDAGGKPVPEEAEGEHVWESRRLAEEPDPRR